VRRIHDAAAGGDSRIACRGEGLRVVNDAVALRAILLDVEY
jgi:hypothetical protein